jgi:TPR repeat protein
MLLVTTGALMFFDLHYGHPHIFAATTRMADQQAVPTAEPPKPASHRRVTDPHISALVDALSPYEIRGLQRQAEYGDDAAALTIGMAYETGRSLPQNCKEAAEWVARAAHDGNAAAQYNLSLRYRTGDGVSVNAQEADKWLRKAANHKYAKAVDGEN